MHNETLATLEALIQKLEHGELTQEQEIEIARSVNNAYKLLNLFLEEVRTEQLKADIQNI